MLIREQLYYEILCEGDKYLRPKGLEEWYIYIDHSWQYLPWIEYIELEEAFQKTLHSPQKELFCEQ